jgi:integrase/recombinase XerD
MNDRKRRPRPAPAVMTGPLAPYEAAVRTAMEDAGYARLSVAEATRIMRQLSDWMASRGVAAAELTPPMVTRFMAARRRRCGSAAVARRWVSAVLRALREQGVVPRVESTTDTVREVLLNEFRAWLTAERGLAGESVRCYANQAAKLFAYLPDPLAESLQNMDAAAVTAFVVAQAHAARRVSSAKAQVTATRALLRFLHVRGLIGSPLAGVVPGVAGWRLSALPRALPDDQVQALLGAHDTTTPVGRRDHALLVLLARLGLRGAEAAALRLADIDWRAGQLAVRGKAARIERLPLPAEVGVALAAYLTDARPVCECATVFITARAPYQPLSPAAVRAIMGRACGRAGISRAGAHRLRHSLATDLLRSGAPLAEVGQVLRHRSQLSTAAYAKVDLDSLRTLAQPWPGSTQ